MPIDIQQDTILLTRDLQFLLVRPFPSLRITFTSPALRIPGLVQTRLLDRIGGGSHLRDSICDAFAQGVGVTAKVPWLTHSNEYGTVEGKPRWLHATPMYGSDDKIGVWMVVMVENESITGGLEPPNGISFTPSPRSLLPLGRSPGPPPAMDAPGRSKHRHGGGSNTPSANSDLYANYLHRERPHRGDLRAEQPQSKQATAQSQREHIRQEQARREATLHEKAAQALARHDQAISQANSPKPNSNFDQLHREHREQDHRSRSPETSRTAPPSKDPETSNRREREASRTRKWAAHLKGTLDRRGGVESPVEEREHEQKSMRRSESVRTPQEATHTKND